MHIHRSISPASRTISFGPRAKSTLSIAVAASHPVPSATAFASSWTWSSTRAVVDVEGIVQSLNKKNWSNACIVWYCVVTRYSWHILTSPWLFLLQRHEKMKSRLTKCLCRSVLEFFESRRPTAALPRSQTPTLHAAWPRQFPHGCRYDDGRTGTLWLQLHDSQWSWHSWWERKTHAWQSTCNSCLGLNPESQLLRCPGSHGQSRCHSASKTTPRVWWWTCFRMAQCMSFPCSCHQWSSRSNCVFHPSSQLRLHVWRRARFPLFGSRTACAGWSSSSFQDLQLDNLSQVNMNRMIKDISNVGYGGMATKLLYFEQTLQYFFNAVWRSKINNSRRCRKNKVNPGKPKNK